MAAPEGIRRSTLLPCPCGKRSYVARPGVTTCCGCREAAGKKITRKGARKAWARKRALPLDLAILAVRAERGEPLFPKRRAGTPFRRLATDAYTYTPGN